MDFNEVRKRYKEHLDNRKDVEKVADNDLAVIIVNYNVRYFLEQCLLSVARASKGLKVEVWVVDNNSTDDSVAYLSRRFPDVHFVQNTENVGFSRANNQAIRQSSSRYVLLLNPDTLVTEHTFTDCIRLMDEDAEIGALGVSMYGSNGRFALESRRALPVPFTSFCKLSGLTWLFPHSRTFGRYYMQFLDRMQPARIEVISGAFNMMRRGALDQIGLLDEDFFMYGEDVDISYRMTLGGWQNWYLPTPIIHYKGESTQKDSVRYVNIFHEAMIIFMDKHFKHRYHHATLLFRAGIYLRAGLGIVKRWLKPLGKLIPRRNRPEWALCIGQEDNVVRMRELLEANGYKADTIVGDAFLLKDGHLHDSLSRDYRYVVYDRTAYSYGQMIDRIVEGYKLYPHLHLATFNPDSGVIVMPNAVLKEDAMAEDR